MDVWCSFLSEHSGNLGFIKLSNCLVIYRLCELGSVIELFPLSYVHPGFKSLSGGKSLEVLVFLKMFVGSVFMNYCICHVLSTW